MNMDTDGSCVYFECKTRFIIKPFLHLLQVKPLIWIESIIEKFSHSRVEIMVKVPNNCILTYDPTKLQAFHDYLMSLVMWTLENCQKLQVKIRSRIHLTVCLVLAVSPVVFHFDSLKLHQPFVRLQEKRRSQDLLWFCVAFSGKGAI